MSALDELAIARHQQFLRPTMILSFLHSLYWRLHYPLTKPDARSGPNTSPSVGEFYCMIGLSCCWQAVGPARDLFNDLSGQVTALLSDWEDTDDEIFGFGMFMVGVTEQTARPTLFVYGRNANKRKRVRSLIEGSAILRRHPYVRLDDCRVAPDFNRVDELQLLSDTDSTVIPESGASTILGDSKLDVFMSRQLFLDSGCRPGSTLFVRGPDRLLRTATAGICLEAGGHFFITTVAHIFVDDHCTTALHSTPEQLIRIGKSVCLRSSDADLDYALVHVDLSGLAQQQQKPQQQILPSLALGDLQRRIVKTPRDAQVKVATTSHALVHGSISGTPSFIHLPRTRGFQEVWRVRLQQPLDRGDCGSMVIDASNGNIYGHVIVGSPSSHSAYILPAYRVLDHLGARFKSSKTDSRYSKLALRTCLLFTLLLCLIHSVISMDALSAFVPAAAPIAALVMCSLSIDLLFTDYVSLDDHRYGHRIVAAVIRRNSRALSGLKCPWFGSATAAFGFPFDVVMEPRLPKNLLRVLHAKVSTSWSRLRQGIMAIASAVFSLFLASRDLVIVFMEILIYVELALMFLPAKSPLEGFNNDQPYLPSSTSLVSIQLGNCTVYDHIGSNIESWGAKVQVGDQDLCLTPSTLVQNTVLMSLDTCSPDILSRDGMTFSQCASRRGGLIDTSSYQGIATGHDEIDDDDSTIFHSFLRLGSTTVRTWFQTGKVTFGHKYLSSHLGLATRSGILTDLASYDHIGSRSWGLNVGSQGVFPRQGSLTLGGYDPSTSTEGSVSFPLSEMTDSSSCLLQTSIVSMALRTVDGYADVELGRDLSACIEPYYRSISLQEEIWADLTRTVKSLRKDSEVLASRISTLKDALDAYHWFTEHPSGLDVLEPGIVFRNDGMEIPVPYNPPAHFSLIFELLEGFRVEIPAHELFRPLQGLNPDGSAVVDHKFTELAIRRERPTDRKGLIMTLGRVFLSQVYLFVDYETGMYSLSPQNQTPHTTTPTPADVPRPGTTLPLSREGVIGTVAGGASLAISFTLACTFILRRMRSVSKMPSQERIQTPQKKIWASS